MQIYTIYIRIPDIVDKIKAGSVKTRPVHKIRNNKQLLYSSLGDYTFHLGIEDTLAAGDVGFQQFNVTDKRNC